MSCFSCFGGEKAKKKTSLKEVASRAVAISPSSRKSVSKHKNSSDATNKQVGNENIDSRAFTFRELAAATKNFSPDSLLGEGGFGRVYKGCFENTGQIVAIKQLDRNGMQGNKEFLGEVQTLSFLHHQNLVNLIGYCADGDQRLLVHEFIPLGSLEDHLLDTPPDRKPLSWQTRMKIAFGAAQGLEYLHDKANPPVIYRDLKASSILLDEDLNPKLSDFGLSKLGPAGSCTLHFSSMMGTYGYCAPEYARDGEFTLKSDVYSFGVILLELISGRRVSDTTKPTNEQNLVAWAQPMFRDQKRFPELVDTRLNSDYPIKALNQAVGIAAMCLQEEASVRPLMVDVVVTLSFLTSAPTDSFGMPDAASVPVPPHEELETSYQGSSDEESTVDHEDDEGAFEEGSMSSSSRSMSINSKRSRHGRKSE